MVSSDRAGQHGGLECPRCGCRHLPVLYTRQRPKKVVRARQCRHCGRRVVTQETIGNVENKKSAGLF
jgi:transcriptional regulator NrdR family protein